MFRVAISFIIFFICAFVGYEYGESYRKRLIQLKEILKSLSIMQNYILYGTIPLPEAFESMSHKLMYPLNEMCLKLSNKLYENSVESVYTGAHEEYEEYKDEIYLNEDDLKVLADFFRSLGESGVYGQDKIFTLSIESIKVNLKYCEEDVKKNVKLYRYLGACIGGMAGIFIL